MTKVRPGDLKVTAANVVQQKTKKDLSLPIHPNLRDVLDGIPGLDKRELVVMTQWGKPFSPKALGMRMQNWTNIRPQASRRATPYTVCARRWASNWPSTAPPRAN